MLLNSGKKVEALNGISKETIAFMTEVHENMTALRGSTTDIAYPLVDKFYNGVADAINGFNVFAEGLSDEVHKIAVQYGSTKGAGPVVKESFEEVAKNANLIKGSITTAQQVEISDGLHEQLTEETIGSFTKNLVGVLGSRDGYIMKVASIVGENQDADTAELYTNLGKGVEKMTNAFVNLFNANASELKALQIDIDEVQQAVKVASSNVTETGSVQAAKVGSLTDELA